MKYLYYIALVPNHLSYETLAKPFFSDTPKNNGILDKLAMNITRVYISVC